MTVDGSSSSSDNSKRLRKCYAAEHPVSVLLFVCCLVVLIHSCSGWFDTDGFFIIATGRKMWETGILHTHPFSVLEGMHTIIQQWLWCYVVSALYDSLGGFGVYLLLLVLQFVLALLFYAYMTDGTQGRDINRLFVFSICMVIASLNPYISIRPEIITVDLLMAQCLCMKKYIRTERPAWLYAIPVLMLAEINIHASYWSMHLVLLMPYLVPSVLPKYFPRDGVSLSLFRKHWVHFIVVFLLTAGALFVNPYGVEGIAYVFLSLKAGISSLPISELSNTEPFSLWGAGYMLLFALYLVLILKRKLTGVSFYMLSGLLLLLTYVFKWFLFFPVVLFFVIYGFREELFGLDAEKLRIKILKIPAALFIAAVLVLSVYSIVTCDRIKDEDEAAVVLWLKENNIPADTPIFTGFNIGARLEFEGYESIYLDARPELYSMIINGRRDQLDEYCIIMLGQHINEEAVPDAVGYVERALSDYGFEYYIVSPCKERLLYALLSGSDDYSCIVDGKDWCLYRRTDNFDSGSSLNENTDGHL